MHQNGAQVVAGQTQCTIVVQFIESFLRNHLTSKAYMYASMACILLPFGSGRGHKQLLKEVCYQILAITH